MYRSYTHVEALNKYPDYLLGDIYITPKLDGTNACVYWENGEVKAGSRKRAINIDSDNAGFALWVQTSKNDEAIALREFFTNSGRTNWIIYGEFGVGSVATIKRYIPGTASQMWIFDVYDIQEQKFVSRNDWAPVLTQWDLNEWIIPIIGALHNPTMNDVVAYLDRNHFRLADDDPEPGEGIVIRNEDYRDKFGKYIITKIVRAEFRAGKSVNKSAPKKLPDNLEAAIVNEYIVESDILKTKAKIALDCGTPEFDLSSGKQIGMLLNYVYRDLLVEEIPYIVTKRYKGCTINFGELRHCSDTKVRSFLFGV